MSDNLSRRDAIRKAAIAGGTLGVVWSAPKIEGLTLRPNYAAASSHANSVTATWNALGDGGTLTPSMSGCWNAATVAKTQSKDLTLEITHNGTLTVTLADQNIYDTVNEGSNPTSTGVYNFKANRTVGSNATPVTLMFDFTCT